MVPLHMWAACLNDSGFLPCMPYQEEPPSNGLDLDMPLQENHKAQFDACLYRDHAVTVALKVEFRETAANEKPIVVLESPTMSAGGAINLHIDKRHMAYIHHA